MFGLFGRKPEKRPGEIVPDLKRRVVQLQEETGINHLAIAEAMLTFGFSLLVEGTGAARLATTIETIERTIEQEQANSSLGSHLIAVNIPAQPPDQYRTVIDKLADIGIYFDSKGYSQQAVGAAMAMAASDIVKIVDKENLLSVGLLRKECERLRRRYRQEQLSQTASGERSTEKSVNILLQAEAEGFTLDIEGNGTFVLREKQLRDPLLAFECRDLTVRARHKEAERTRGSKSQSCGEIGRRGS